MTKRRKAIAIALSVLIPLMMIWEFHCPMEAGFESCFFGKDATGYMQAWFYVATHENWAAFKDNHGMNINTDFVGEAIYPMGDSRFT